MATALTVKEVDAALERTRQEFVLTELDTVREAKRRKIDELLELRHALVNR